MLTFLTKTVIDGQLVIFDPSENINYISKPYIETILSLRRVLKLNDSFIFYRSNRLRCSITSKGIWFQCYFLRSIFARWYWKVFRFRTCLYLTSKSNQAFWVIFQYNEFKFAFFLNNEIITHIFFILGSPIQIRLCISTLHSQWT